MNTETITIPKIGEQWPGLDAVYAGLAPAEDDKPQAHLILWNAIPEDDEQKDWKEGIAWGKNVDVDTESHVPMRSESALLYATLRHSFDTDYWYWTSTLRSEGVAFSQYFDDGCQGWRYIYYEARCRAVSRLIL